MPYSQYFFRDCIFTPFKENSEDDEELVEEYEIKKIVEGTEMDFICKFYSYRYPDYFFACTTVPDQNNLTMVIKLKMKASSKNLLTDLWVRRVLRIRYRILVRELLKIRDSEVVILLFQLNNKNPIIYIMLNCILFWFQRFTEHVKFHYFTLSIIAPDFQA